MAKLLIVIPEFQGNKIGGNKTAFKYLLKNKDQKIEYTVCSFITKKTKLYPGIKYFLTNFKSILNFYLFLKKNNFDIIYLNSFFSFYNSILIILIFKIFINQKNVKIVISPRGELFANLIYESLKKIFFIKFFKFIYRDFFFLASNNFEKNSISKFINAKKLYIFNDCPTRFYNIKKNTKFPRNKILKIIFLSRITKSKNLLFILQIIKTLKLKLIFDIYGPIEDLKYWTQCQNEIFSAPKNILINYKGIADTNDVQSIFFKYDLFCFPSLSENFGYVIYESLSSGTPVLCDNILNYLTNIKSDYLNLFFLKKIKNKKEWKNEILKFSKLSIKEKIKIKKKLINFYKSRVYLEERIYFQQLIKCLLQ
jgi:hypothetical protein